MSDSGKFWGPLPVYVIQDHRHKAGHLRVLGAILSCPQPYFPSLKEIAERSGHTPRYCSKMITQMVRFGTLEREQRYNATNVYRLVGYTTEVETTTEVHTEYTTEVHLKESLKENKHKGNGVMKGFDLFCSVYPRHRLGLKRMLHEYWTLNRLEKSADVIVNSVLGSIKLLGEEDAADAILLQVDGVNSTTLRLLATTGTSVAEDGAAIQLSALVGGISIQSDANLDRYLIDVQQLFDGLGVFF